MQIREYAKIILISTLSLVTFGLLVLYFMKASLSLEDHELRILDGIVIEEIGRARSMSSVTREASLFKISKVGDSKSGYFTYSAISRDGKRSKWRAFWTIHAPGAPPVISRIEPLSK
jgi:hypothetical protein